MGFATQPGEAVGQRAKSVASASSSSRSSIGGGHPCSVLRWRPLFLHQPTDIRSCTRWRMVSDAMKRWPLCPRPPSFATGATAAKCDLNLCRLFFCITPCSTFCEGHRAIPLHRPRRIWRCLDSSLVPANSLVACACSCLRVCAQLSRVHPQRSAKFDESPSRS